LALLKELELEELYKDPSVDSWVTDLVELSTFLRVSENESAQLSSVDLPCLRVEDFGSECSLDGCLILRVLI